MAIIIVSGTPGTGKTTLAKKLLKLTGYIYIDVKKIISKYNLSDEIDEDLCEYIKSIIFMR